MRGARVDSRRMILRLQRGLSMLNQDLPTFVIDDQRALGADESHTPGTIVQALTHPNFMFPNHRVARELVNRQLRVRSFGIIIENILAAAGHDLLWKFGAHAPKQNLQQVDTPISHESACVVPKPPKVEV